MVPPRIVAEIGCNHKGEMTIAREMIKIAAMFCEVDFVKFQKRCVRELLTEDEYIAPHPEPYHSYGSTYGEHRERLEFNVDQHRQLAAWCEEFDVGYSTSVWDLTSAREIVEQINPTMLKVPSACNLNESLLGYLCDEYAGEVHLSFGMTTRGEEEHIVDLFRQRNANQRLVIYSCTSGYPVPFNDICLLEIARLREQFGSNVKAIGFSGHHLGIAVDMAALTLGAEWIERHYTLDRTWRGTDHAASLEPDGLRRLTRDARHVAEALQHKEQDLLEIEVTQRAKLKRCVTA